MDDKSRQGSSTPAQFSFQSATTEDLLKSQTVGLVNLADFRKRRAEVLELKEREAQDRSQSGTSTPFESRHASPKPGAPSNKPPRKKRKAFVKGKVSFGSDDDEDTPDSATASAVEGSQSHTPDQITRNGTPAEQDDAPPARRLGPNTSVGNAPKVMTKSAMMREAQTREQLRKDFLVMQEAVKGAEISIPFVFYDGTSVAGGVCKVKKGDFVWLFLDQSRKKGASLSAGGGDKSRKDWARIGVDDLMLVRGEVIIPHHYAFYYFIVNKTRGFNGVLFDYSDQPTSANLPAPKNGSEAIEYDPLARPSKTSTETRQQKIIEGANDDPNMTKVVDRRWYERNKHIFPASVWEEFAPDKDYTKGIRKDTKGNNYFFS